MLASRFADTIGQFLRIAQLNADPQCMLAALHCNKNSVAGAATRSTKHRTVPFDVATPFATRWNIGDARLRSLQVDVVQGGQIASDAKEVAVEAMDKGCMQWGVVERSGRAGEHGGGHWHTLQYFVCMRYSNYTSARQARAYIQRE
eukprot:366552-Chlamydomonas_euryale.AAC.8